MGPHEVSKGSRDVLGLALGTLYLAIPWTHLKVGQQILEEV